MARMVGTRAALVGCLYGLALASQGCGGGGASPDGAAGTTGAGGTGAGGTGGAAGGCAAFAACGGNVVGTWRISRRCVAPMKVQAGSCAGEEFDFMKVVSDLTWTFAADLTQTVTLTASGSATVKAPEACLVASGAPIACADAGAMYAPRIAIVGAKAGTPTCQSAAGICTCAIPFVAAPEQGTGPYSVSGTALTFTLGADANTVDYCATATTLTLQTRETSTSPARASAYDRQ